jgi:hypothetical protein
MRQQSQETLPLVQAHASAMVVARKQEFTPDQTLLLRASIRERHGPFEIAKSFYAYFAAVIIPVLKQRMS